MLSRNTADVNGDGRLDVVGTATGSDPLVWCEVLYSVGSNAAHSGRSVY